MYNLCFFLLGIRNICVHNAVQPNCDICLKYHYFLKRQNVPLIFISDVHEYLHVGADAMPALCAACI